MPHADQPKPGMPAPMKEFVCVVVQILCAVPLAWWAKTCNDYGKRDNYLNGLQGLIEEIEEIADKAIGKDFDCEFK